MDAVIGSGRNYIVVFPNNDLGSEVILNEYRRFNGNQRFRVFSSLRFEYFLTLLKHADFIIGNSSAGIREAGIYGIPAIDIGSRQSGRYIPGAANIQHVGEEEEAIRTALMRIDEYRTASFTFGDGKSTEKFLGIVREPAFWNIKIQKRFVDHAI